MNTNYFVIEDGILKKLTKEGKEQTVLNIPEGVVKLQKNSFLHNYNIKEIHLPKSLKIIEGSVFRECTSLERIDLNEGLIYIGEYAFALCSIKSIIVSNSVTHIKKYAFAYCKQLKTVTLSNKLIRISNSLFLECSLLEEINIPDSVISIEANAFERCSSLKKIKLPSALEIIESFSFGFCSKLKEISFPEGVKEIRGLAFYNSGLEKIFLPKTVTTLYVGYNVGSSFACCKNLSTIIIDKDNRKYDSRDNCNAIIETDTNSLIQGCQNTKIPDSVETISAYAFVSCNLNYIKIPKSVTRIEDNVFNIIDKIYYEGTEKDFNKISIANTNNDIIQSSKIVFLQKYKKLLNF